MKLSQSRKVTSNLFIIVVAVVFLMPSLSWADPQQDGNMEIRSSANRISERALSEFVSTWNEFRTLPKQGGRDDGSRLTGYLLEACAIPNGPYWRDTSLWLTNHVRTNRAPREARRMSRDFRRKVHEAIKHFDAASKQPKVLEAGETMLEKPNSPEHDLRQRAELMIFLRDVVSGLAANHEADPRDFGTAYAFVMWRRMQCDFTDDNTLALTRYVENSGYPGEGATDARTTFAGLILFANITDTETKRIILEHARANKEERGISEETLQLLEQSMAESLQSK